MTQIKKEIKARARLARGLTNGLEYDVDCLYSDVENFWYILHQWIYKRNKGNNEKVNRQPRRISASFIFD